MSETIIPVELGARSYEVRCGHGLLERSGPLLAPLAPRGRALIVADRTVWALHGARICAGLAAAGLSWTAIEIEPGESAKSWDGLGSVCAALAQAQAERGDLVVACGGGVVGDLAGLAAGLFKRGMDFVQIPTTLLAQVDSSVGGKTAINIAEGKNLIGLFHQPRLVLADFDTLSTLPVRELRAGLAEVIKYGLIDDAPFFAWLEQHAGDVLALKPEALGHAVTTSVRAKARIVALDERESGPRALLNLGHTFGHGLEAVAGYDGRLLHGEAVAAGMAMAFDYAAEAGDCPPEDSARVHAALQAFGLASRTNALAGGPFTRDAVLAAMANDKKAQDGRLTLILPQAIGRTRVVKGVEHGDVARFLDRHLQA